MKIPIGKVIFTIQFRDKKRNRQRKMLKNKTGQSNWQICYNKSGIVITRSGDGMILSFKMFAGS